MYIIYVHAQTMAKRHRVERSLMALGKCWVGIVLAFDQVYFGWISCTYQVVVHAHNSWAAQLFTVPGETFAKLANDIHSYE